MNKKQRFKIITLLVLLIGNTQLQATDDKQVIALRERLQTIAEQCSQVALKSEPDSARYQQMLAMSRSCLQAIKALKTPPKSQEDLSNLYDLLARQLTPYTSAMTRGPDDDSVPPVTLPLDEIITMIEKEQIEMHLRPSSVQLTAKRIIFRSIVELFSAFGKSKISYQEKLHKKEYSAAHMHQLIKQHEKMLEQNGQKKADSALFKAILQSKDKNIATTYIQRAFRARYKKRSALGRMGSYLKKELWDDRSLMALRTMRIMSNKFIDKIIPNPKRKKWQKFAELLIPLVIGHLIAFIVSKGRTDSWRSVSSGIANDIFIRLIMVQLFMEKKNIGYFILMGITYLLAFYNSETSNNLWHAMPNEPHHAGYESQSGFFNKRTAHLKHMCSENNLASVAIDGISSLVLYKLIDDVVMPQIKIPKWLLATPVSQTTQRSDATTKDTAPNGEILKDGEQAAPTTKTDPDTQKS